MLVCSYEQKQKMTTVEHVLDSLLVFTYFLEEFLRQQHGLVKKAILRRLSSYCIGIQYFQKVSVHGGRFWRDVLDHFPLKFQRDFVLNIKKCLMNNVDL